MDIDLRKNKPLSPLQQAGLSVTRFNSPTLELMEVAGAAVLRLHSLEVIGPLQERFADLGIELPGQTNQSTRDDPAVLCLRPREWLLFSERTDSSRLLEKLRAAITPALTTLLDTSDGLATFRLSGPGSPWLLAKLSGLDFVGSAAARRTQTKQHFARTRMADIAVIVHYHSLPDEESSFVFDLLLDRSLAKYLWELLIESAPHADELKCTTRGIV